MKLDLRGFIRQGWTKFLDYLAEKLVRLHY